MEFIDLWNPTHPGVVAALVTALLLGLVHGMVPDEHTWPITFSYAVGSYSTRKGLRAGLLFSLTFTVQRAIASELAWLGLSHWMQNDWLNQALFVPTRSVDGKRRLADATPAACHAPAPDW